MSIRARLLLLVFSVLLPVVGVALWLIAQTWRAERAADERTLRDTTRALAMVVGRELDQRAVIARVLSLSRTLDNAPDVDVESMRMFELQAARAMQGLQGWVELSDESGSLPGRGKATGLHGPVRLGAAGELAQMPRIAPLQATAGGELRAAVVQPVLRGGSPKLNLAVTILPSELQRIIDQQRLPPDWVAAVVDNRGTVVARQPGGTRYAGRMSTDDLKKHLVAGPEGPVESVTLDGVPVVGYFSTSPQGWTYITSRPKAGLGTALSAAVTRAGIAALLLLAASVAGAMWVARRIAVPVQALKRAAQDMQAGRPVVTVPSGIAECDEVATALADAGQSLRHNQEELARQVQEAVARTRLAEQRASHGQRVEALGRLTGGVAHDFNNLLGVISNSAHLIQRQTHNAPELQVPLSATLRAVEVGSRLTQHLLRVAGRQPVRPQQVDLARYLVEVQELLQTVLGKRPRLTVEVDPHTPPVKVDTGELELALINLMLNARDALPDGGQVWLAARRAEAGDIDPDATGASTLQPGDYVLITVTDDGVGADEATVARAFEPFFTTKPVGKGTGLGLSQVHGLCTQSGGSARLASTPGLGTTVSLLLPVQPAHQQAHQPAGAPVVPGSTAVRAVNGLHVLLVEDHVGMGETTTALLQSFDCRVTRATSGEHALALLQAQVACDIVLSDVVMPGSVDGLALGRLIRQRWPALPVVLSTGYSEVRASLVDFVVLDKPYTPVDLMHALQAALAAAVPSPD